MDPVIEPQVPSSSLLSSDVDALSVTNRGHMRHDGQIDKDDIVLSTLNISPRGPRDHTLDDIFGI